MGSTLTDGLVYTNIFPSSGHTDYQWEAAQDSIRILNKRVAELEANRDALLETPDCLRHLEYNEPHFIVRGKDWAAYFLVRIWWCMRTHDWKFAEELWEHYKTTAKEHPQETRKSKLDSARLVAISMLEWLNPDLFGAQIDKAK